MKTRKNIGSLYRMINSRRRFGVALMLLAVSLATISLAAGSSQIAKAIPLIGNAGENFTVEIEVDRIEIPTTTTARVYVSKVSGSDDLLQIPSSGYFDFRRGDEGDTQYTYLGFSGNAEQSEYSKVGFCPAVVGITDGDRDPGLTLRSSITNPVARDFTLLRLPVQIGVANICVDLTARGSTLEGLIQVSEEVSNPEGGEGEGGAVEQEVGCEELIGGGFSWALCGLIDLFGGVVASVVSFIYGGDNYDNLAIGTEITGADATNPSFVVWRSIRDVANIALVIVGLYIVISIMTGYGGGGNVGQNYALKKLVPRMLLGVIMIQLSFYGVGFLLQLNNSLAYGVDNLIDLALQDLQTNEASLIEETGDGGAWETFAGGAADTATGTIGGAAGLAALGVAGAIMYFAGFSLVAFFGTAGIWLIGVLAVLVARKAAIIALLVFSPAIVILWIIPGTQSWAKRWWSWFSKLSLMFVIIVIMLNVGELVSQIFNTTDISPSINETAASAAGHTVGQGAGSSSGLPQLGFAGSWLGGSATLANAQFLSAFGFRLMAAFAEVLGPVLSPMSFALAGSTIGGLQGRASKFGQGLTAGKRKEGKERGARRRKDPTKALTGRSGRLGKAGDSIDKAYNGSLWSSFRGSKFGGSSEKHRTKADAKRVVKQAKRDSESLKEDDLVATLGEQPYVGAILSAGNDEAAQALVSDAEAADPDSEDTKALRQAYNIVRHNGGWNRGRAQHGLMQSIKNKGFGLKSPEQVIADIDRMAGSDPILKSKLLNDAQTNAKASGRFDLSNLVEHSQLLNMPDGPAKDAAINEAVSKAFDNAPAHGIATGASTQMKAFVKHAENNHKLAVASGDPVKIEQSLSRLLEVEAMVNQYGSVAYQKEIKKVRNEVIKVSTDSVKGEIASGSVKGIEAVQAHYKREVQEPASMAAIETAAVTAIRADPTHTNKSDAELKPLIEAEINTRVDTEYRAKLANLSSLATDPVAQKAELDKIATSVAEHEAVEIDKKVNPNKYYGLPPGASAADRLFGRR